MSLVTHAPSSNSLCEKAGTNVTPDTFNGRVRSPLTSTVCPGCTPSCWAVSGARAISSSARGSRPVIDTGVIPPPIGDRANIETERPPRVTGTSRRSLTPATSGRRATLVSAPVTRAGWTKSCPLRPRSPPASQDCPYRSGVLTASDNPAWKVARGHQAEDSGNGTGHGRAYRHRGAATPGLQRQPGPECHRHREAEPARPRRHRRPMERRGGFPATDRSRGRHVRDQRHDDDQSQRSRRQHRPVDPPTRVWFDPAPTPIGNRGDARNAATAAAAAATTADSTGPLTAAKASAGESCRAHAARRGRTPPRRCAARSPARR